MQRTTNLVTRSLGVALALAFSASAIAANKDPMMNKKPSAPEKVSPPLVDWHVDQQAAIAEIERALYPNGRQASAKAPLDKASVFRPVPVCRLVDTRGFPAAVAIAGPLQPNTTTNVSTNAACGIPTSGVVGLSVSVSIQNQTPNSGGFITLLQQGAPVTGVSAVLNFNTVWTATTANVSIPNASGDFAIRLDTATANVIIDINGYFQDLNELDVGNQQFDLNGTGAGIETFQFTNSGTGGTALTASGSGTDGVGFRLVDGELAVTGANTVGGDQSVFVHSTGDFTQDFPTGTRCSAALGNYTVVDHPMLNGNPSAVIFVQPRDTPTTGTPPQIAVHAFYGQTGCTAATADTRWMLRRADAVDFGTNQRFNILIIQP